MRANGSGTATRPIVVTAYGSGTLPRLVGNSASALVLRNVSGWTVENLDLSQLNQTPQALDTRNDKGKDVDNQSDQRMTSVVEIRGLGPRGVHDCGLSCTDSYITLKGLLVHDGQWDGIYVGAGYSDPDSDVFGFVNHLTIDGVESRGNQSAGIDIAGTFNDKPHYRLQHIAVLDTYVHDNGGDGVVMGQTQDGLIQGDHCAYNGRIRNARIGCWAWDSRYVTIQYNESDHNMTPLGGKDASDGGGLDLDVGSVDSTMQYNWTHDNEGEGYLLENPLGADQCCATTNVTARFNVSERDAIKEAGAITVVGGVKPAWIYNNTVYYVASRPAGTDVRDSTGGALTTRTYGSSGSPVLDVANNAFISDGRVNLSAVDTNFSSDGKGTFTFNNDLWQRVEGGVAFHFGASEVTSWGAWQGRGYDVHGENGDLAVTGPLGSGPMGYQLRPGSRAIDAASNLAHAPLGMGGHDYFGTSIPQGAGYDIGSSAFSRAPSSRNSNANPPAHLTVSPSVHVAWLGVADSSKTPASSVARGSTVYWGVKVEDGNGAPVSGATVRAVVYTPSWDSIYATVAATTDSTGTAWLSHKSANGDPAGTYFFFLSQVVPGSTSVYYDSSQNTAWTDTFTLK